MHHWTYILYAAAAMEARSPYSTWGWGAQP